MSAAQSPPSRRVSLRLDGGFVVLLVMIGLVLASVLWAVSIRGDLDHANERVASLQTEIDLLRAQANATAYQLAPTTDAPVAAHGSAFFSLDGMGVIAVSNLAPAPEGRSYQVWYYPTVEAEPIPGATFTVDKHGSGFMLIPADVGVFTNISITLEPEAGTTSPSGPVILSGATGGARG